MRSKPSAGVFLLAAFFAAGVAAQNEAAYRSLVQNEAALAVEQPGPHEGEGRTTAYPFFAGEPGFDLVFRKRVLHPGSSIGLHRNDKDEIYYVLSGRGELQLQGETRTVGPGDAILTRDGHSHALRQQGDADLVIFVVYRPSR
jgi:quercetin dioxygenase-like cupin family protein